MKETFFENKYGKIRYGTEVYFEMENASMWGGDTHGFLVRKGGKWQIQTKNSGVIGIGGYLEAYPNTIYPVDERELIHSQEKTNN